MFWNKKEEANDSLFQENKIKSASENANREKKDNSLTNKSNYQNEETVSEKRLWQMKNIFTAFWIFILFIVIAFALVSYVDFFYLNFNNRVILWTCLTILYAIILYFLLEPGILREINKKEYHTVEKEVYKEVPVVKEVVKEVEKPVVKEVIKEVPVLKEVVREIPRPKLNIPKYDYVGSSLTRMYHTNNCRLGKSIKKKYKEHSNNINFFKNKKYKACKVCITKEVKV